MPSAVLSGPAMLVNSTFTAGNQQTFPQTQNAVAVSPGNGTYVVVWSSQNQDGSGWGVYGQLYNNQGVPQGTPFQVNTTTTGDQQYANAAFSNNGTFVVTWSSNQNGNWDVYARQFAANGTPLTPEFLVNNTTTGDQQYSHVATDASGNFVVTWQGNQTGNWDIYARSFNGLAMPLGGEFRVNSYTTNDQEYPSIAMAPAGNFVISWSSAGQDGSGWGVYAQNYQAGAVPNVGEYRVNSTTSGDQVYSSVAINASGNWVITWASNNQDGSGWGVYGKVFQPTGAGGNEFPVNTFTAGDQTYPAVAMQPNGNFVVTWSSQNQDGSGWGVYAQNYQIQGNQALALGGEYQVNSYTAEDQLDSSVAVSNQGNMVFAFSSHNEDGSGWGVYAQRAVSSDIVVTPTTGLTTPAVGSTATFAVVLAQQPTAPVSVSWSSSDPTQGVASPATLLFTPLNWSTPQTVTVTGTSATPVAYVIDAAPAVSLDPNYQGELAPQVAINGAPGSTSQGAPGFTITPASLTTSETGTSATFSVALNTAPVGPVTLSLSLSDPTQGTLSQTSLYYNPSSWNIPQSVTVTGLDDHLVNGDQTYQITGTASSSNPNSNYAGLTMTVTVTNTEADTAGFTVTPTGLTVAQGGTTTFDVALTSKPTADVTVAVNSSNPGVAALSQAQLTFTPASWNVPQPVTVTGVPGPGFTGNLSLQVVFGGAASTDPVYLNLQPGPLSLSVQGTGAVAVATSGSANGPPAPVAGVVASAGASVSGPTPPSGVLAGLPDPAPPLASGNGSLARLAPGDSVIGAIPSPWLGGGTVPVQAGPSVVTASLVSTPAPGADGARAGPLTAGPSEGVSQLATVAVAGAGPAPALAAGAGRFQAALGAPRPADSGLAATGARADLSFLPPGWQAERFPEDVSLPGILLRTVLPRSAYRTAGTDVAPAPLASALDELEEQLAPVGHYAELQSVALTGALATTGYVLLNTRAGFWLLSLMTTRPLWKDFDALEVVYAWEKGMAEKDREPSDPEDNLLALVE